MCVCVFFNKSSLCMTFKGLLLQVGNGISTLIAFNVGPANTRFTQLDRACPIYVCPLTSVSLYWQRPPKFAVSVNEVEKSGGILVRLE